MGMYTWMNMRLVFRDDLTTDVQNAIRSLHDPALYGSGFSASEYRGEQPLPDHPFFHCRLSSLFFRRANGEAPEVEVDGSTVEFSNEFKNYNGEVSKFLRWCAPYLVKGEGFKVYEETKHAVITRFRWSGGTWFVYEQRASDTPDVCAGGWTTGEPPHFYDYDFEIEWEWPASIPPGLITVIQ